MAGGYSLGVQAGVSNSSRQQARATVESSALEKIFSQKTEFNKARSAAYAVIAAAKIREKGETERNTLDNMFEAQNKQLAAESAWKVANLEDKQKRDKDKMTWDMDLIKETGLNDRHAESMFKEMGYDPTRSLLGAQVYKAYREGRASLQDFVGMMGTDTPNNLRKDADDRRAQANKDRDVKIDLMKEDAIQGRSDREYNRNLSNDDYSRRKDKRDFSYKVEKDAVDLERQAKQDRVGNAYKGAEVFGKASKGMKEYFSSPQFGADIAQRLGLDPTKQAEEIQRLVSNIPQAADAIDQMTKFAAENGHSPDEINAAVDKIMANYGLADRSDDVFNIMEPYIKARSIEQHSMADLSSALGYHISELKSDPKRTREMMNTMIKSQPPATRGKFREALSYAWERAMEVPGFNNTVRDIYGGEGLDTAMRQQAAKQYVKEHGGTMQDAMSVVNKQTNLAKYLPTSMQEYALAAYGDDSSLKARWQRDKDDVASAAMNFAMMRVGGPVALKAASKFLQFTGWVGTKTPILNHVTGPVVRAAERGLNYVEGKLVSNDLVGRTARSVWDTLLSKPKRVGDSLDDLIKHDWDKVPPSKLGARPVEFPNVATPEGPTPWSNEGPAWAPPEAPWGAPEGLTIPPEFAPATPNLSGVNLNPQPMPRGALIKGRPPAPTPEELMQGTYQVPPMPPPSAPPAPPMPRLTPDPRIGLQGNQPLPPLPAPSVQELMQQGSYKVPPMPPMSPAPVSPGSINMGPSIYGPSTPLPPLPAPTPEELMRMSGGYQPPSLTIPEPPMPAVTPGTIDMGPFAPGSPMPPPPAFLPPQRALPEVSSGGTPIPQPGSIMESYNPGPASVGQSLNHADLTPPPEALLANELARSVKTPDPAIQLAESLRMTPPEPVGNPTLVQPELTTLPEPPVGQAPQGMTVRGEFRPPVKGVVPEADAFSKPQLKVGGYYKSGVAGGSKQYTKVHEGVLEEISPSGKAILRAPDGTKKAVSARRLIEALDPKVETQQLTDLIATATQAMAPDMDYYAAIGIMDDLKLATAITGMSVERRMLFQQAMTTGNKDIMRALLKKQLTGE